MIRSKLFAAVLLAGAALMPLSGTSFAQDSSTRIDLLEEQIRLLTGKVEELNFTVKQLQGQVRKQGTSPVAAAPVKKKLAVAESSGDITAEPLEVKPAEPAPAKKKLSLAQNNAGEESIYGDATLGQDEEDLGLAPAPQNLSAAGKNAAATDGDGGFQGQVVVPGEGEQVAMAKPVVNGALEEDTGDINAGGVEPVALQPETPESLYKRSDEALLRRQFPEAEQGFRGFLEKYPDHSLSGSAQYWLGETFYAQGDYRTAAQNFLTGYQKYPKSRRAADSLLKLGLSLNKLGQKSQACAALGSVSSEFPKSVEAKKRAQSEFKRVGC